MKTIGRRLSVLLIDDEPLVRTATAEMIRDLGHHVEEAGGGAEALARLDDGLSVDVVITDYMMPGMTVGRCRAASRKLNRTSRSFLSPAIPAQRTIFFICLVWPSHSARLKLLKP